MEVLIVDDEPDSLLSLEYMIKKEGYWVFIAHNGAEAFSIIRQELPDLLLLDVMMPQVDGYEVCSL
ncbi:response regulator [Spirosoma sp. KCTC 42546]|uniref:response regulator n=1 Tax=Spirosoma sp. KCTC 42546 TaxID=2520506 RepID=UPI00352F0EEB